MNTAKKIKTDYLIYCNGILHAIVESEAQAAEAIALLRRLYPTDVWDVWTAGRRKIRRPTQSVDPTPSAVGR